MKCKYCSGTGRIMRSERTGECDFEEWDDDCPVCDAAGETDDIGFRAGYITCREQMANFVYAENPTIAKSIQANWMPELGKDPLAP